MPAAEVGHCSVLRSCSISISMCVKLTPAAPQGYSPPRPPSSNGVSAARSPCSERKGFAGLAAACWGKKAGQGTHDILYACSKERT